MASQESRERAEGGGEKEGVGGKGSGDQDQTQTTERNSPPPTPERSVDVADDRRLGPWHQPDIQRQRALADRLSNPALRSSRPHTAATTSPGRRTLLSPDLHPLRDSPYSRPQRAHTATSRMNDSRASSSSGPPGSPRRPLSTPGYGSASPRRQPPLFQTPATSRKVTDEELDGIVERMTRPTVSSRGGVDLEGKDFTYIQTPRLKTLPVVPGLERRYLGLQKVDNDRMEGIVYRLTRLTSAYKAKFAPNRNVYVDREPGAHMVAGRRNVQSAV